MRNEYCDLHTHSVFSDGTWTPEQLIDEADRLGLSAIALTDHNTVDGLGAFLKAAEGKIPEAIPGVEFSTDYLGMDIHVVALYVEPDAFQKVTGLMEEGRALKDRSNRNLIANLRKKGFSLDYDAIAGQTPGGQVNRAHIAAQMVKKGWVKDMQQAFHDYLEPGCGLYTPPGRPDIFAMISFIRSVGAVPILAHPFLKMDESMLRVLLPKAKDAGLQGMETVYVSFDEATTVLAKKLAGEYGLLMSGGSDFHGDNKPGIHIGVGRGNLRVPAFFRDEIRKCREKNRKEIPNI